MRTVNVHAAKTHLSSLLEEVQKGEEIMIAKAGKPIARLVPFETARKPRQPGMLRGQDLGRSGCLGSRTPSWNGCSTRATPAARQRSTRIRTTDSERDDTAKAK